MHAPRPADPVHRPVNANLTMYVVGTDGELHSFSTPAQYLDDGYDTALVVTVPNLGGLTVGSTAGTALTALATSADGAIVDFSGTFFTFAGGKAFGIPTPAALAEVQKTNPASGASRLGGPRRHRRPHRHWGRAQRGRPRVHQLSGRRVSLQDGDATGDRRLRRHPGCPRTSHRGPDRRFPLFRLLAPGLGR